MQTLELEGELTIFTAAEQKTQLLNFLNSGDELELNVGKISEIDSAGLQLLILLKREAANLKKTFRLVEHNKAVMEVLELANLTSTFGDQMVLVNGEGA